MSNTNGENKKSREYTRTANKQTKVRVRIVLVQNEIYEDTAYA